MKTQWNVGRQGRQPNGATAPLQEPAPDQPLVGARRWSSCRKNKAISGLLASGALFFMLANPAAGADAPAKTETQTSAAKRDKELHGRLPAHYGKVVDSAQRQRIYAIQGEYAQKIRELETQLALLKQERDQRIAGVLSPQQQKQVAELKAGAKARRQKAKQAGTTETYRPAP